jgi:hypothetical protein
VLSRRAAQAAARRAGSPTGDDHSTSSRDATRPATSACAQAARGSAACPRTAAGTTRSSPAAGGALPVATVPAGNPASGSASRAAVACRAAAFRGRVPCSATATSRSGVGIVNSPRRAAAENQRKEQESPGKFRRVHINLFGREHRLLRNICLERICIRARPRQRAYSEARKDRQSPTSELDETISVVDVQLQ